MTCDVQTVDCGERVRRPADFAFVAGHPSGREPLQGEMTWHPRRGGCVHTAGSAMSTGAPEFSSMNARRSAGYSGASGT